MWRPDFEFIEKSPARLAGFGRRFWQGSHDHRGLPESPGRVVTLIQNADEYCDGIAYLLDADVVRQTFEMLDHREKNGYDKFAVSLRLVDDRQVDGLVYIGAQNNFAWLGDAPLDQMAAQIARSAGPSGRNIDYLLDLASALRAIDASDAHVFALEAAVSRLADDRSA